MYSAPLPDVAQDGPRALVKHPLSDLPLLARDAGERNKNSSADGQINALSDQEPGPVPSHLGDLVGTAGCLATASFGPNESGCRFVPLPGVAKDGPCCALSEQLHDPEAEACSGTVLCSALSTGSDCSCSSSLTQRLGPDCEPYHDEHSFDGVWRCNRRESILPPAGLARWAQEFRIHGSSVVLGTGEEVTLKVQGGLVFLEKHELSRIGDILVRFGKSSTLVYEQLPEA
eukprot:TRINITY_DN1578_c0_g2_i2.p1 TRINITY_DN1578_c0_g2~~TRINITY_DN1578_c0_g2_i2.p1  ORF type:complete len:230 (+),score=19.83 TRINITY_DN1578_c0_g2_i2:149-838(+)